MNQRNQPAEQYQWQVLINLAKVLGQQNDFQEILRVVAQQSAQYLKADLALVLMINPETRETVKTVIRDGKQVTPKEYRQVHIHVGGWIIKERKSFASNDLQKDKRFIKDLFKKVPVKAVLGTPLFLEGSIIGAILLLYKQPAAAFSESMSAYLESIAAIAAPFLRNMQKIKAFFESVLPEETLLAKYEAAGLLGKSVKFRELLHAIEAAARCDVRVLLEGRTGTGKELIARAIHRFSARSNGPFVAIDCGAMPHHLIESELFGHKRGAFTGANYDRKGLFAEASSGTLFIDEIANLPLEMQSKLMRVLQEGEVRPLGSNKSQQVDVRVIAASSTPLRGMVAKGEFREDLFFRLHVYPIFIPGLIERKADIALLANHFLKNFTAQQTKSASSLHAELLDFMKTRPWSGNIRELENFVERLVTMSPPETPVIDASILPTDLQNELEKFRASRDAVPYSKPLREQLQEIEAEIIRTALVECNWNQSQAARKLQTSEKNIRYKMQTLGIRKPAPE